MPNNLVEDLPKITQDISTLKQYWRQRNLKFQDWYAILILIDQLKAKGMESYVSNEPQTFYNMAHYLLTKGKLSHTSPIQNESALELDKRAKVNRSCEYMWETINRKRRLGGEQEFVDDLGFYLLVLGWYATAAYFNERTGEMNASVWNPYEVYPRYNNGRLTSCLHSYDCDVQDARAKSEMNGWYYQCNDSSTGNVKIEDYYKNIGDQWINVILIDGNPVTPWVTRPEMHIMAAPVAGFPDKGNLIKFGSGSTSNGLTRSDWRRLSGRGIFEVNQTVYEHFNKWKSMITQILRDVAQPLTQEISDSPQATPEQIRERGALFHYSPGEQGLQRVGSPAIPPEITGNLRDIAVERQKGSFNDVVYGLAEGRQAGYSLSLLAGSSANQILYPYMDGKHFVVGELDRFWLTKLKSSGRVYPVQGQFLEKLQPTDIPKDVHIKVESRVATPRDWLERGNIARMLENTLDEETILTEILEQNDPQAIRRRKKLNKILDSEMSITIETIAGYYSHADYLDKRGDRRQAALFRRAAQQLEAQLGAPAPGQARAGEQDRVERQRIEGAPDERVRQDSTVNPPENTGFTPEQLRQSIGRGNLRGG